MPRDFPDFDSLKNNAKMRGWRQPFTNETETIYRHRQAQWLRGVDPVEAAEVLSGLGWDRMSPMALLLGAGVKLSPLDSFLKLPVPEDPFKFMGEAQDTTLTDWLMDPCLANNSSYFVSTAEGGPVYKVYFRKPLVDQNGIVVASIACSDRHANIEEQQHPVSRGALRQLIAYLNAMSYYTMTAYISFEQVLTPWLQNKLTQYGFEQYRELSYRIRARHPALLNLYNPTANWTIETALANNVHIAFDLLDMGDGWVMGAITSGYDKLWEGKVYWNSLSEKAENWLNNAAR